MAMKDLWQKISYACALALLSLSSHATERTLTLTQVSKHAYYAEGASALGSPLNKNFISNAGVVIGPTGVVVIDALGSPALGKQLIAEIRKLTDKPIQFVIATHYHADHIYGLQSFIDIGATVIAQESAKDYLGSDTAKLRLEASRTELAPWINDQTRLVPASKWIVEDTRLNLAGLEVDLIKMGPAHTPDDLAVYFPSEGVLFAGDLVFRGRIPYVGQADSLGWIQSLDKLLLREAQVIVPGHGPSSTSAAEDLKFTRDYLVFVRQAMQQAARDLEPFDEAYAATDWSRYAKVPLFNAANRMNAYNIYISIQNE
jgi:glyoxylase-like metal-dependent hydrolase (beta-lactamase superfamily II)